LASSLCARFQSASPAFEAQRSLSVSRHAAVISQWLGKEQTSFRLSRGLLREEVYNNARTFPSLIEYPQVHYELK
jgi:hypothetical protein